MITILSIAGYDPSGGAGILADIKTFAAFGCYGVAAISSLTAQNTIAVYGASHQSAEVLVSQISPLFEDFTIAAAKTGMLPTVETIEVTAAALATRGVAQLVVDPVIRSTSGYDLIDDIAARSLIEKLLPLARVTTPNLAEAERLTGMKVRDLAGMERAARRIREICLELNPASRTAVLVKGGHLLDDATDLLLDGEEVQLFPGRKIETRNTHGTGCTLSAAIAARLGLGSPLAEAVSLAKRYVEQGIRSAPGLGHGAGPLNHIFQFQEGQPI